MLGLNGKLLDFIYPVGSYYETSDTSFNPNTAWGGTWVEDTKGRVTVALDSEDTDFDTINEIGGSKYLQSHQHEMKVPENNIGASGSTVGFEFVIDASKGKSINKMTMSAGTGDSGNLQPYIVVKRWHRTA